MKTCPACQQTYPDDVESCPRDGARLAAEFREERECPYCAERILKKARICKHCGRDVEPQAGTGIAAQTPPPAETPVPFPSTGIVSPPAPDVWQPLSSTKAVWPLEQSPPDSKREAKVNPKDGLNYVWIPPGSFQMGCSPGDTKCPNDEKPPHQVTITKGFWLGETEVTVGAYKRFAAGTGTAMPAALDFNPGWSNDQMPIVNVSWHDAQACCVWAGGRLPTEAEWEYAARAGSTASHYGDLDGIAWYGDNSGRERLDSERIWKEDQANYMKRLNENGNRMQEVGQKRPNGFGLYDMLGNVSEWVNDWSAGNYYQYSPSQDPSGPTSGKVRVLRGGSWYNGPGLVRVSFRFGNVPGYGFSNLGFRCGGKVFAR